MMKVATFQRSLKKKKLLPTFGMDVVGNSFLQLGHTLGVVVNGSILIPYRKEKMVLKEFCFLVVSLAINHRTILTISRD